MDKRTIKISFNNKEFVESKTKLDNKEYISAKTAVEQNNFYKTVLNYDLNFNI